MVHSHCLYSNKVFFSSLYHKDGDTALMWAACAGRLEILSRIIDSGARVDIADEVSYYSYS